MPYIAMEERFALKGGTAINLFVRDMPRLSIDIDLAWLPLEPREKTLEKMSSALRNIADVIRTKIPGVTVGESYLLDTDSIIRLTVSSLDAVIKIEPNLVIRGTLFPCEKRRLCGAAQEMFEMTTTAITASMPDLYAGKLCAALDRQHPRDIFDIKVLLENEGITDKIRTAFVVYLASHDRPMSELLDPGMADFRYLFDRQFAGMTMINVDYDELVEIREKMVHTLNTAMTKDEKDFLLSVKQGVPRWDLMPITDLDKLPAIQWKLMNIRKMNRTRHALAVNKLRRVLER
ncbi:nucleotidyl transferase AbiEii/AbiGii toxin family protein [Desulfonatronospira sp.]|uniref:nucleotidyl transferase AbiEii/AbiGii toxin family protein n=1 Tax=Desulfonatronospira sp. TaxID=1962951 RepID=UPI0025B9BA0C|nr:nucleotidyl transferase AbiEii/AbiGii toxin family protein [Desulfonatronospira sp.]